MAAAKIKAKPQLEPGQYSPSEAPPAPSGSRFALPKTSSGISVSGGVAGAVAVEFGRLLEERRKEAVAASVPIVTVRLKAVKRTMDGGFGLVDRGILAATPVYSNNRPSLRWRKMDGDGGKLLDSFLLGEKEGAFGLAPDVEIWDGLLSFAEQLRPDGGTLRRLNDLVAIGVAMRAGLEITRDDLPHIG